LPQCARRLEYGMSAMKLVFILTGRSSVM
jgi:hypothetical protein